VTSSTSLNYGGIDVRQSYTAIPQGYAMQYVDCGSNGTAVAYDVRWNVMNIDPSYTRLVTASARPLSASSSVVGGPLFALPVTLRAIAAP